MYAVRMTRSGFVYLKKGDDLFALADVLADMPDAGESCVSDCLESGFVADLCAAGFLVMSYQTGSRVLLYPKYHNSRSALFFENLHVSASVRRFLPRYEICFDRDFDGIVDKCVVKHGGQWLTEPLLAAIREIRRAGDSPVKPVSFGLYRDGELKAGEFGVIVGRVYTSYSGYYEENSAGRVQMILTARYLKQNGFAFWDLGMPLPYKNTLGAVDIDAQEWTRRFREGITDVPLRIVRYRSHLTADGADKTDEHRY
jgi:Leu/Phe-tRNA-protein transferase